MSCISASKSGSNDAVFLFPSSSSSSAVAIDWLLSPRVWRLKHASTGGGGLLPPVPGKDRVNAVNWSQSVSSTIAADSAGGGDAGRSANEFRFTGKKMFTFSSEPPPPSPDSDRDRLSGLELNRRIIAAETSPLSDLLRTCDSRASPPPPPPESRRLSVEFQWFLIALSSCDLRPTVAVLGVRPEDDSVLLRRERPVLHHRRELIAPPEAARFPQSPRNRLAYQRPILRAVDINEPPEQVVLLRAPRALDLARSSVPCSHGSGNGAVGRLREKDTCRDGGVFNGGGFSFCRPLGYFFLLPALDMFDAEITLSLLEDLLSKHLSVTCHSLTNEASSGRHVYASVTQRCVPSPMRGLFGPIMCVSARSSHSLDPLRDARAPPSV
ncbi:nucleobase-ascorbate transporter 8 [Striga asiatica]|uniref:Nucleobase-ascorbate transporter 8 n=1 Tax=Striga asiatica TaxID=4170 RepID=A0A5A7PXW3_STRAF|nr:nucleobase-ascorbate transporter 8 [Striga asiatica]